MKIYYGALVVCSLLLSFEESSAMQVLLPEKTMENNSVLGRLVQIKRSVVFEVDKIRGVGEPRKVAKGAYPEIILDKGRILFNEKELRFDVGLEYWKNILGGSPRCSGKEITLCIWDDLGLDVGTGFGGDQKVKFINIKINVSDNKLTSDDSASSARHFSKKVRDLSPHQVFTGYLELDGFGIDSNTKFWEIRRGSGSNKKLHCGLRDCGNPSGPFNENSNIYLTLDGQSESARLLEFSISVFETE